MRKKKLALNDKMIKEEALRVSTNPEFKAIKGWFQPAKKRMKLSRRSLPILSKHYVKNQERTFKYIGLDFSN